MNLINLYNRFKNQYRIHKHYLSAYQILKMSYIQTQYREILKQDISEGKYEPIYGRFTLRGK